MSGMSGRQIREVKRVLDTFREQSLLLAEKADSTPAKRHLDESADYWRGSADAYGVALMKLSN
jgi:hypothetical protein